MKAPYAVTITQLDDGTFLVQVGCKTLAFVDFEFLRDALASYFSNPEKTIKQYTKLHGWNLNEPTAPPGIYAGSAAVGRVGALNSIGGR